MKSTCHCKKPYGFYLWMEQLDVSLSLIKSMKPIFVNSMDYYTIHSEFSHLYVIWIFKLDDGIITLVLCILFKLVNYDHIEEVAIFGIFYLSFVSACVFRLSSIIEVGLFTKNWFGHLLHYYNKLYLWW